MNKAKSSRRGGLLASAAAVLLIAGCGSAADADPGVPPAAATTTSNAPASAPAAPSTGAAKTSQGGATTSAAPSAPDAPSSTATTQAAKPAGPAAAAPAVLEKSVPVRLGIPSIGVDSPLISLGRQDDGSAAVPPGNEGAPAGWYKYSPTPGERGPAVILGHVNSLQDDSGVFYHLDELKKGQKISVTRTDGTVAVFRVDRHAVYAKKDFPTLEVYGNTTDAQLRLITCDGFSPDSKLYETNLVVYATLVSHHAG